MRNSVDNFSSDSDPWLSALIICSILVALGFHINSYGWRSAGITEHKALVERVEALEAK